MTAQQAKRLRKSIRRLRKACESLTKAIWVLTAVAVALRITLL